MQGPSNSAVRAQMEAGIADARRQASNVKAQVMAVHEELLAKEAQQAIAQLPAQHSKQDEELCKMQAHQREWTALLQMAQQRLQSKA